MQVLKLQRGDTVSQITFEVVADGNIEQCRDLCNELMAFQKSKAVIAPEAFDKMSFDTRLKYSFENSPVNQAIVAKDAGTPIGYVFSTIESVKGGDKSVIPDWAPGGKDAMGFYPPWENLPDKAGCLSQIYVRPGYQGAGIGIRLFEDAMRWLESFSDVDITFVYISNGNDAALNFYLKRGFTFSHDVFGGFIKAAYKRKG